MKYLFLILFFSINFIFSQQKVKKGVIETVTDDKISFEDLEYLDDQVQYTNSSNLKREHLFLPSIKKINETEETEIIVKDVTINIQDTLYGDFYPDGIYVTKEDFLAKKPSSLRKIVAKGLYGFVKEKTEKEEHNCYFYDEEKDEKLKNVFAVVYNGKLYFQIKAILNNRNSADIEQNNEFPNSFVKALFGGKKYIYTEVYLIESGDKMSSQLLLGGVGGIIGVVSGGLVNDFTTFGKGVVWDFKKSEFNIFTDCDDFNYFIKTRLPKDKQECKQNQPDVLKIRKTIYKIK